MSVIVSKESVEQVANLITNMVSKEASTHEMTRIIRYSVDVINAERSVNLMDQSYNDNGIAELKRKYQGI